MCIHLCPFASLLPPKSGVAVVVPVAPGWHDFGIKVGVSIPR